MRTFTEDREGSGEVGSCSQRCLNQGVLEGDGHGVECPGSGDTVAQEDLEETPAVAELGRETQDLEDQSSEQSLPTSPKAGESPPRPPLALFFWKACLRE